MMRNEQEVDIELTDVNGLLYEKFGRETQWLIAAEECSELTKALLKSIRNSKFTYSGVYITPQIIEETAHVMICLNGIYQDMNFDQKVSLIREIERKLILMKGLLSE